MFIKTTHHVKVTAVPSYLKEQSDPAVNRFVWAYTIHIENLGEKTVQLLSRHWRITNALGQLQEVRGEGVIGETPVLKAGEKFHYTSGTALSTPSGIMVGSYQMVEPESGHSFEIDIPAFSLDSPHENMRLN